MVRVRTKLRDPVFWLDAAQLLKTVGAAVLAWVLAGHVLDIAQPFLAPWAALLTVHATVYRTLARGAQQVGATVLGVLLAFAAGNLFGVNAATLGAVLLIGMLAGSTRGLRDESTTAAATGLVVLLTGYSGNGHILAARLLDTFIGIAVGLVVNLLVWPPLRDRSAARQVDRIDDGIGALLTAMAERLRDGGGDPDDAREWAERTRDLDHDIDGAWATVRQARESGRLNLRRRARVRVQASQDFGALLERLEQATAETRSMARTIGRSGGAADWDPGFRATWVDLLSRAGEAVSGADAEGLHQIRSDLESAGGGLFNGKARAAPRPVHGALLVNLRNILEAMDVVADAQPVEPAVHHRAVASARR